MSRVLRAAAFVFAFAFGADAWFGKPTPDLDGGAVDPVQTASYRIAGMVFVETDCAISNKNKEMSPLFLASARAPQAGKVTFHSTSSSLGVGE